MVEDILDAVKKTVAIEYEESGYRVKQKEKETILTLDETHKDAKCKNIEFVISNKILVYKFDKKVNIKGIEYEHPLMFLQEEKPIRSTCDYIIFYLRKTKKDKKHLHIIICNMKSELDGNMKQQMLSGEIISKFIVGTAIRCYNNWNSETSNKLTEDCYTIQEIAIRSKSTSSIKYPKGATKEYNTPKRIDLECNKKYDLNTHLHR